MDLFFTVDAVASILNTTPGEITEALKESEQKDRDAWFNDKMKNLIDTERSSAASTARSKGFDEGHGKAMQETLTKAEKRLRETFDVDGKDLDEIAANIAAKNRESSKTNPEDVKNSQEYIDMENSYKDRIKKLNEDLESEKSGRNRDRVMSTVHGNLESKLVAAGYVLPEDPTKKAKWLNVILSDMEDDDTSLSLNSDGDPIVLGKDGKIKTDDKTMQDVTFDAHLTKVAGFYLDVSKGDGKEGTGNKNSGTGGGGSQFDFSHIKTAADYVSEMGKINIDTDKDKMDALESYYAKGVEEGSIEE